MIRKISGIIMTLLLPGVGFAAEAAEGGAPQQGITQLIMPIALFVVIFYFLMYRPQKKKQQQHDKMLSSISRGDTVVTAGGFFGKVSDVLEDSYVIEISDGVKARILKGSVSSKRESGDGGVRPRKLKKKRRVVRRDAAEETDAAAESGASPAALDEGVSPEENNALMDGPGAAREDEKKSSSEETKN